jgi:hypothetical protein
MLLTNWKSISILFLSLSVHLLAQTRDSTPVAKKLANPNPAIRQLGAEEIAHNSSVEHLKLVEGYRLQEKNDRVKLALDWALYRLGNADALYKVVLELGTKRADQASLYLTKLDSPEPLHKFLDGSSREVRIRLIDVLAVIGDSNSIGKIQPFTASADPMLQEAAKEAVAEINNRLASAKQEETLRPRRVGTTNDEE